MLAKLALPLIAFLAVFTTYVEVVRSTEDISPDPEVVLFVNPESRLHARGLDVSLAETPTEEKVPSRQIEDVSSENVDSTPSERNGEQANGDSDEYPSGGGIADVKEGIRVLEDSPATKESERKASEKEPSRATKTVTYYGPLPTRNQHPLYLPFFNFRGEKASILPKGKSEFKLGIHSANTIIKRTEGGAVVDLDLETWTYSFEYRRSLGEGEYAIYVPLHSHSHGIMDNLIDRWHRFFGLPRGNRPSYPTGDFRYFVATSGGNTFNFASDQLGLGDAELLWKRNLTRTGNHVNISYRIGLKLPTGNSEDGIGSGGTDVGVGILGEKLGNRFAYYVNLSYVLIGEGDFAGLVENGVLSGMFGAEYSWRPSLTLVGQMDFSQSPFTTGSAKIDRDALELILGFNRRLGTKLLLSGGFSEDIRTETAPDFTVIAELKWLFGESTKSEQ